MISKRAMAEREINRRLDAGLPISTGQIAAEAGVSKYAVLECKHRMGLVASPSDAEASMPSPREIWDVLVPAIRAEQLDRKRKLDGGPCKPYEPRIYRDPTQKG